MKTAGVVVLTQVLTSGNRARDFIPNVVEKQVADD